MPVSSHLVSIAIGQPDEIHNNPVNGEGGDCLAFWPEAPTQGNCKCVILQPEHISSGSRE